MKTSWAVLGVATSLLISCAPAIVTREQAVATVYRYAELKWQPEERHVQHGPDTRGIEVHTPDVSLVRAGDRRAWWKPGETAKGMPYQWGGFDTPESFLQKLEEGKKAGDISTPIKRHLGDAGTSLESCGIDCSGLISRCWNLPRLYSTQQLPEICVLLNSWEELRPGDIVLNHNHVALFVGWATPNAELIIGEAGPLPVWRVNVSRIKKTQLLNEGYAPWRYRKLADGRIQ